jgi:carboxylate-amine ligase
MLGLVALTRCLVVSSLRLMQQRPQLRRGDLRRHWIAVENKWLATRYGLEAMYIRTPGGKRRPLAADLAELLDKLMPLAREAGDQSFLAVLQPIDRYETGAVRQRRLYRETGSWKALIDEMTRRLIADLEETP